MTLPLLAAAALPPETDVGFTWGRGRHFNVCGSPSTFGAYSAYVETRIPAGVRIGAAGAVLAEDPAADENVAYMATAYAGYDWRWFGFTAGGGGIGRTNGTFSLLPQLTLRGGGETGLRGETGFGLLSATYPVMGILKTGAAWGGDLYEVGLGLELLPWLTPGVYGYGAVRIDELVLRVQGHFGPSGGAGEGYETGVFGTVGLHFDHLGDP